MQKLTYIVSPEARVQRLDIFISFKGNMPRSFIQRLLKQGLVTVNLKNEKASYKVKPGDQIEFTLPDTPEGILLPEDIPVDFIWEDEYMLVVNKPPYMVMYPARGYESGTLMNAVIAKCSTLSSVGAPLRPGVVHRLDKDTSGLIVIAKDDTAHHNLVCQFKEREVEKIYLALLNGRLKQNQGEITTAIGRSVSDRKKMSTSPRRGKEAITKFEVVRRFGAATLAKVSLVTGRTHQIRVHFSSIGHSVLGDRTYGKKTSLVLEQRTITFKRQMLHSHILKLKHPVSGEPLEFKAPMPDDMEEMINELE